MSATGARETAQSEIVADEQAGDGPLATEAATEVEIEREEVVEAPREAIPHAEREDYGVDREAAAEKVRAARGLPPALRECLAKVTLAHAEAGADGMVRVPIEAAMRAMEEAVPEFLRAGRGGTVRAEHPAGETFFLGEATELSDAEAEEIARGQLARSGLLRGQRARAAE